jgi:FtsZ-interacting cell division protein ZipA
MDMGAAMIVVMAVMMLAMLGGGLWAALRSRARRRQHPQRPAEQDVDKPTGTAND